MSGGKLSLLGEKQHTGAGGGCQHIASAVLPTARTGAGGDGDRQ